jgi:ketosteroid isomerase-like protein
MPSLLRARVGAVVGLILLSIVTSQAQQPRFNPDQKQIIDAVKTIFVAAKANDMAKFDSVVAPGFYLYDGGQRFDGEAIMNLMKSLHAQGKRLEWNVTEPDVHVYGDVAWIAYVNKGSITDASGTTEQKWLESAFLQKHDGQWKIVFMHSTRVPPPK